MATAESTTWGGGDHMTGIQSQEPCPTPPAAQLAAHDGVEAQERADDDHEDDSPATALPTPSGPAAGRRPEPLPARRRAPRSGRPRAAR